MRGLSRWRGARLIKVLRSASKNDARRLDLGFLKPSESVCDRTRRFSSAYPAPEGLWVRSAEYPPLAVGRPRQVGGVEVQITVLRNPHDVTWAEEIGMREDQFRG